jgi:hypothetical protein
LDCVKYLYQELGTLLLVDKDKSMKTCLDNAINAKKKEVVDWLEEQLEKGILDSINERNSEKLEKLLESVDIDSFDFLKPSMLETACKNGDENTLKILFKYGASAFLEVPNQSGFTPLESLFIFLKEKKDLEENFISTINFLYNKGSRVNINENKTINTFCGENKVLASHLLNAPLNQFEIDEAVLDKLTTLDFSNSSLLAVPQCVSKFNCLVNLKIGGNSITSLPSFLINMKDLNWDQCDWGDNPLSTIPGEILGFFLLFLLFFLFYFFYFQILLEKKIIIE